MCVTLERVGFMKVKGLLSIPGGILCQGNALGKTFCGVIAGVNIEIHFPSFVDSHQEEGLDYIDMDHSLIAPPIGANLSRGGERITWGYLMKAPKMDFCVERVMIEFDCSDTEVDELAQKVYANITEWSDSFVNYLQLATKQRVKRREKMYQQGENLELLCKGRYVENQHPHVVHVHFYGDTDFASSEAIEQAVGFASSGKELFLEYQMLLSAYAARKEGKNRQAIIDACSAVEICLTNWITNYCKGKDISPEILTEKYRTLGDRFRLVSKLDPTFPVFDFNAVVVKPRNDVAHNRDVYPTDACTDGLIEVVEKYMSHYHTKYY